MARRRQRVSSFTVGALALVLLVVLVFLGFTKEIPFSRGFQVKAVFESANSLRVSSPVRIAGVDVGKVIKVDAQEGTTHAVVTLEIDEQGLPLHDDARAKIRPRIFLEGNFFVDLEPGTPGAQKLSSGDTIKVTQTATPVQLDQVLTALQSDTRDDLRDVLDGLGTALSSKPSAADDRQADPAARGETAAKSFNDAYDDLGPAERAAAQVNEALLGLEPERDLRRLLDGGARTAAGLVRDELALRDLIVGFNATVGAFASEEGNLRAAIRALAPTLEQADGALGALNAAFPPTRAFAREILPGVRATDATIQAAFPWVEQARALLSERELGGLAAQLAPIGADGAALADESLALLPQADAAAKCARDVLLPTGDVVIRDEFTTGVESYKEFFYALVGLAGEGQNFDGNGMYVRFQPGGGDQTITLGRSSLGLPPQFGALAGVPLGNRPAYPGRRPPYEPGKPCFRQRRPNLNGPAAAKTPPLTAGAGADAARRP